MEFVRKIAIKKKPPNKRRVKKAENVPVQSRKLGLVDNLFPWLGEQILFVP